MIGFTCIHSGNSAVCPSSLEGRRSSEGSETTFLPQSCRNRLAFIRHSHSPATTTACMLCCCYNSGKEYLTSSVEWGYAWSG